MTSKALIIGAGLAGTSLAHQLLARGIAVEILDQGSNHSSAIAAGMVNPMVFRRMNKSWRLDEFLPEASAFYKTISSRLATDFYHPLVIRRFFSSEQERQLWEEKAADDSFSAYLEPINSADLQNNAAHNNFGSGRVKNAFWIDAALWVEAHRVYFEQLGILKLTAFDQQKWQAKDRTYDGITYDAVIFCMGYQQKQEATFSYLPLQQTKGQTLLVSSKDLPETESLNRKCFVLPYGNQHFRIGATYEWNNPTLETTNEAKLVLLENLAALGSYEVSILSQSAGVRPTVLDRRPLMGEHPEFKDVYIFNGLGTKGYMMAPTLARELVEHIIDKKPLHPETAISRFSAVNK
ncbi:MAG: NAD(P)/FAD-dependent oxidoreductase [Flavobacteriales bacterium]